MNYDSSSLNATDASAATTLLEIARRWGTPAYAYDLRGIRRQVDNLRRHLPAEVEVLYSLKSNASLGIAEVLAAGGVGADVASAGELITAEEAGFAPERIFVAGPCKSPEALSHLRSLPEAIISIDSASELELLAPENLANRAVLRLRPDFESSAVVTAGPDSRFGVPLDELSACRDRLGAGGPAIVGFHVFAGSQVLEAEGVIRHLQGALELSLRATDILGIAPEVFNLGGGFGVPYGPGQNELDLAEVGEALQGFVERAAPARIVLELGRFLVAPSGWYLTTVVGHQHYQGLSAVIVDGGTHQRIDFCGLDLRHKADPPLALDASSSPLTPTDILGCLSLPDDILAESCQMPALQPGNVLAFANAGAYGLWAAATHFHGFPPPAEIAFDGEMMQVMREPRSGRYILDGQNSILGGRGEIAECTQTRIEPECTR